MTTPVLSQNVALPGRSLTRKKLNKTRLNVYLDLLLTIVFVVEMEEHFSGLPLHELLGLLFAVAFGLHILLHWDWIVSLTRTFFRNLLHESRFNYVLNVLLFVDMIVITVSGILISRTLGLNIALSQDIEQTLHVLHMAGSDLVLIIVALHVAMHWKWIKTNASKYLFGWLPQSGSKHSGKSAQV